MRWWDGSVWTEEVADYPPPMVAVHSAAPAATSRRELRAIVGSLTNGEVGNEHEAPTRGRRAAHASVGAEGHLV